MWMMTPSRKSSIQDKETKKVLHSNKSQGGTGPLESPQLLLDLLVNSSSNLFSSHLKTIIRESIWKVLESSGDNFRRSCGRP